MRISKILLIAAFVIGMINYSYSQTDLSVRAENKSTFVDAVDYGFLPDATGTENMKALQAAVDKGGTIQVSQPGTYKIAGTVYVGSNTSVIFGNGVFLKKVNEQGEFTHVILNKGALTKTYDEHISIEGMHIIVNGVDKVFSEVYGLRGHLAFFYVKDLLIKRFRCLDLGTAQFCVHVCTFEDVIIDDVIIKGNKDGVHFGRGKRFRLSNGVFQTYDDAVALNGHDYSTSNPEMGWIEDGIVERCYDLADGKEKTVGYFCRFVSGAWIDWKPGMEVQHSDAVVSNGRIYRVQAQPDGTKYKSVTPPTHESGSQVIDGINWGVVQEDVIYSAGVRNVTIRDIFLQKPRTSFSVHLDNNRYNRSFYPGAELLKQEQLTFSNIKVMHDKSKDFMTIGTSIDAITIINSNFRNNKITFFPKGELDDYGSTKINMIGCVFSNDSPMTLILNKVDNKKILLKTSSSIELNDGFEGLIDAGNGEVLVESDLKGLKGN